MASRLENAIDAIQDEFQNITEANGYRNDLTAAQVIRTIRHPKYITTFPEVGIQSTTADWRKQDGTWTKFDGFVEIKVAASVKPYTDLTNESTKMQEALDSLEHDFNKVMAALLSKYKVDGTSPWVVMGGEWKTVKSTVLSPTVGLGQVVVTFQIKLRNVTTTFE